MSCFMRICPLIADASPVVPGEENRWHHANGRLQRLIAAVFGRSLYVDGNILAEPASKIPSWDFRGMVAANRFAEFVG